MTKTVTVTVGRLEQWMNIIGMVQMRLLCVHGDSTELAARLHGVTEDMASELKLAGHRPWEDGDGGRKRELPEHSPPAGGLVRREQSNL